MYDYDGPDRIWEKFWNDYSPMPYNALSPWFPARCSTSWTSSSTSGPATALSQERLYQFVEGEYMKAGSTRTLIDDPSGVLPAVYFPRIFGGLKPFGEMPNFPLIHEMLLVPPALLPLGHRNFERPF